MRKFNKLIILVNLIFILFGCAGESSTYKSAVENLEFAENRYDLIIDILTDSYNKNGNLSLEEANAIIRYQGDATFFISEFLDDYYELNENEKNKIKDYINKLSITNEFYEDIYNDIYNNKEPWWLENLVNY